jgi:hypothetical protein
LLNFAWENIQDRWLNVVASLIGESINGIEVTVPAETPWITFWTSPVDEEIIKLIVEELHGVLLWGLPLSKVPISWEID